ncbi:hypothetical protein [Campylobacter jejuni]|nr:hypothetical protein [Campylobacter jejuni]
MIKKRVKLNEKLIILSLLAILAFADYNQYKPSEATCKLARV